MAKKKTKKSKKPGITGDLRFETLDDDVYEFLVNTGLFTRKQAEHFAFDIAELLEAVERFPRDVEEFARQLENCHKDATDLEDAKAQLWADLEEFRYHRRYVVRTLDRVSDIVWKKCPPYCNMTEKDIEEWGIKAAEDAIAHFEQVKKRAEENRRRKAPRTKKVRRKSNK